MNIIQINSIADLIANFIPNGIKEIEDQIAKEKINHPVTIGSMYEGLTREVINWGIFKGLGLKVVLNSHIEGAQKEFDLLLIEGDASKIAFSDRYICKPEQVIAIIQIKKNLYSADLKDAYNNLKAVIDYFKNQKIQNYEFTLLRDGFRSICRKDITKSTKANFTNQEQAIYYSLLADAQLPIRIVWGYHGFKTEHTFREALYQHLEANLTTDINNIIGYFGPHNFPNLIISDRFTMLKNNGMPFGYPLLDDGAWAFYPTSSQNPIKFLLEVLWTKISYRFEISANIFGEDLEVDQVNEFLNATYGEFHGHKGWHYNAFSPSKDFFNKSLESIQWAPIELDAIQHVIVGKLCAKGFVSIDDDLTNFVTHEIYNSHEEFLERLLGTGLVYIDTNQLKLLTDECQCVIHPSGKFYAADNKSNRLTNWIKKEMNRYKTDDIDKSTK